MNIKDIVQLKITLKDTKPPIWRRILVDKSTNFSKLHHIILATMGWDGGHLYEFDVNGESIGMPDKEFAPETISAGRRKLGQSLISEKQKFVYTYDFGDSWEHLIEVEKFLDIDKTLTYPCCIDGALNCPPEDCGGVWGFYQLLETINNKKHPEHTSMLEWLGAPYDAAYFDKNEINKTLGKLKK